MSLASSSSAQLRYMAETSFGVLPGSGNPTNLRMTGESLSYGITTESSKEINASRQTRDTTQISAATSGAVNLELAYREYDPFLESLLANTFTVYGVDGVGVAVPTSCIFSEAGAEGGTITAGAATSGSSIWTSLALGQWFSLAGSTNAAQNTFFKVSETTPPTTTVITVDTGTPLVVAQDGDGGVAVLLSTSRLVDGTTTPLISYTLESHFADVTEFFRYTGMIPSKLSLAFASAAIVTGSIDFMGKEGSQDSTTIYPAGIGSAVASQSFGLMNAVTGVGQLLINGAPLSGTFIKSINLGIDAKLRTQDGIGHLGAVGIGTGTYVVDGSLEIYLNDGSLYATAIADSPVSIGFRTVDTAGNGYAITLPRTKLSVPSVNAGSMDTDVMLGFDFTATPGTSGGLDGQLIAIDRLGVARE